MNGGPSSGFSVRRALRVTQKDLRLGPRSPIFLWAVALPVVLTLLVTAVFGSLFDSPPSLAVVDDGDSAVTADLHAAPGLEVTELATVAELRSAVERHVHDAGLVLPTGFDDAVAAGDRPPLELYVAGSSLASNRIVVGVATLGALRELAGQSDPVDVVVTTVGDEAWVPVEDRMIPFIVFYAVVIAGMFLPAASLVDEREKRTLDAVLATPTRMSEVLLGKAVLGLVLAVAMGLVTLGLNGAFGGRPVAMTVFLVVGAAMVVQFGLLLGCWARDSTTLFSAIKGGGFLIALPAVVFLFPALPEWIGRLVPTYYFLGPIYSIATRGTTLGDHLVELAVGLAITAALVPVVVAVGRRTERRMALAT